jgi:hypothetical protein
VCLRLRRAGVGEPALGDQLAQACRACVWISQTFLQLVLLSVIIVGQNVLAAAADKRAEATYNDADAVLHEAVKIQEHLLAQDKVLGSMIGKLGAPGGPWGFDRDVDQGPRRGTDCSGRIPPGHPLRRDSRDHDLGAPPAGRWLGACAWTPRLLLGFRAGRRTR